MAHNARLTKANAARTSAATIIRGLASGPSAPLPSLSTGGGLDEVDTDEVDGAAPVTS